MVYRDFLNKIAEGRYSDGYMVCTKEELGKAIFESFDITDDDGVTVEDFIDEIRWDGSGKYVYDVNTELFRRIEDVVDFEFDKLKLLPFELNFRVMGDFYAWRQRLLKEVGYKFVYFIYSNESEIKPVLERVIYTNEKFDVIRESGVLDSIEGTLEIIELRKFSPYMFYCYNIREADFRRTYGYGSYKLTILDLGEIK